VKTDQAALKAYADAVNAATDAYVAKLKDADLDRKVQAPFGESSVGAFIQIARETGVRCMECAGFADLVYLPSGDQALTRRATARSSRVATVVKFSKTRKRNERQGVLVEEAALEAAQKACEADAARRERQRERRGARAEAARLPEAQRPGRPHHRRQSL
jgi:hypothetical protein